MSKAELRKRWFPKWKHDRAGFFYLFFMKNAHVTDELVRLFGWYYTPGNRLLARNKFTWKFLKAELLQPLMLLRAYGISSFLRGLTTFSFVQLFWLKQGFSNTPRHVSVIMPHDVCAWNNLVHHWSLFALSCDQVEFPNICYNVGKSRES